MPEQRVMQVLDDARCQQELLPQNAAAFVEAEIKKASEFAVRHRDPSGIGYSSIYGIQEPPERLDAIAIARMECDSIICEFLPRFDAVYDITYRGICTQTAAWGLSRKCALLAEWNDDDFVTTVWAEFFDTDSESILAATSAISALGRRYPLIYVDWAWEYFCDAHDEGAFSSMLRSKLETIAKRSPSH